MTLTPETGTKKVLPLRIKPVLLPIAAIQNTML